MIQKNATHFTFNESVIVDCAVILTCGAKTQTYLNGEYTKMPETWNDRPSYRHTSTSTIYLYYYAGTSIGKYWNLGPNSSSDSQYAIVFDSAQAPDWITRAWLEYNNNTGFYDSNLRMSTKCKSVNRDAQFEITCNEFLVNSMQLMLI